MKKRVLLLMLGLPISSVQAQTIHSPNHRLALTIARQAKGRDEWYLGSITDENARRQAVKLDFLRPGQHYEATIYADGPGADWEKNPTSYRISRQVVTSKSTLKLKLVPGGGAAVSIKPVGK